MSERQLFNPDFFSLESKYNNKNKKVVLDLKKTKFDKSYPNLSFNDLQIQNEKYSTDDGCIHYKNITNNQIYSWNFIENEWEQHSVHYQNELMDLFRN